MGKPLDIREDEKDIVPAADAESKDWEKEDDERHQKRDELNRRKAITGWRKCFLWIAAIVPLMALLFLVYVIVCNKSFLETPAAAVLIASTFLCFTVTYAFIIRSLFADGNQENATKIMLDVTRRLPRSNS